MFRKLFTIIGTLGIIVGFVALIGLMAAARPEVERQEPKAAAPTVFYEVADARPVRLDVRAQGEVRPRTDINLTAQVAGRVVATAENFVNGGAFKANEVLVRIEDADYRVALASARARLAQAREALRREEAESELARQDYEDLGLGDNPSDLALRKPQLAQARANYNAAVADVDAAQLNLDRTKVSAPFDGRVRERIAGPGEFVSPGAQLGRVFSTDVAEIRLPLTDSDLARLGLPIAFSATEDAPGPKVTLSAVVAGEFHEWDGHIERTDGAIDPTTRQISAIAVVEDPYGAAAVSSGAPLTIGLFVDAEIEGRPFQSAIVLPRAALYGRDRIFVINRDDVLEERIVDVVSSDRDTITIARGVSPGERVAASPLRGAVDGDKVTPAVRGDAGQEDESPEIANASADGGDL
ncbi:MAG: efflux RND transporter periplasmic adaptor subunit [Pseudomonadota bacterium]